MFRLAGLQRGFTGTTTPPAPQHAVTGDEKSGHARQHDADPVPRLDAEQLREYVKERVAAYWLGCLESSWTYHDGLNRPARIGQP